MNLESTAEHHSGTRDVKTASDNCICAVQQSSRKEGKPKKAQGMQSTCPETGWPMREKLEFPASSDPRLSICLRNVKGEIWPAMLDTFTYTIYAGQGSLEEHI